MLIFLLNKASLKMKSPSKHFVWLLLFWQNNKKQSLLHNSLFAFFPAYGVCFPDTENFCRICRNIFYAYPFGSYMCMSICTITTFTLYFDHNPKNFSYSVILLCKVPNKKIPSRDSNLRSTKTALQSTRPDTINHKNLKIHSELCNFLVGKHKK